MSVAILSGSSSGIGAHLAAKLLRCTALDVVALSSRPRVQTEEAIRCLTGKVDSRLTVLSVDGFGDADGDLEKARKEVESRWGKGQVRAIICSSGIVCSCAPDSASFTVLTLYVCRTAQLYPEKSLAQIDPVDSMRSFQLNTLSHLLVYKHFVPLMPTTRQLASFLKSFENDPAKNIIASDLSLCLSISARVGSISDNRMGGSVRACFP